MTFITISPEERDIIQCHFLRLAREIDTPLDHVVAENDRKDQEMEQHTYRVAVLVSCLHAIIVAF